MKFFIFFVAVVALVSADEKKPAQDEKPRSDDKSHLVWPLPDPVSEGDLMLHGAISWDRVRALHKVKLEEDVDKMILAHGRLFLRRVSKFFDENGDFKIMPILCRDSRNLNATNNRWRIEIPKVQPAASPVVESKENAAPVQRDSPIPKDKQEKADDQARNNLTLSNETETTTLLPSSTSDKPSDKPTSQASSQSTQAGQSSQAFSTTLKPEIAQPAQDKDTYEIRRRDFYRQVGSNFARLLMREYRKESMSQEETEYLAYWIADEAVHFGAVSIYCNEGENVKEIKKNLVIYLEEKSQ